MPLAPHPLLQATSVVKSQPAVASSATKTAETGKEGTSSFARVFAKHAQPKTVASHDSSTKSARDKSGAGGSKQALNDKSAASTSTVADSGKSLPADKVSKKADDSADGKTTDPALTDVAPVDPALDPAALQALVAQPPVEPVVPVAPTVAPPVEVPAAVAAAVAMLQPAVPAPVPDKGFDPAADPLAGLPAVQMALEQSARASMPAPAPASASTTASTTASASASASATATSTSAPTAAKASPAQGDVDPLQAAANNLAVITDQPPTDGASTEGGDKAFKGLIEDGLKDVKASAADTRIDDFANRLAALSQAVQPKEAAALPMTPSVAQPLAMHQSGWSDAVVDRVMYMSSQNLKSADIQLEPAELGRLDIRVNMAPDQQTQVTFMSAHAGVREALEGQMSKLRDSFTEQGLGQVNVNVSDQSGGWQGQGQNQQQQANQGQRSGGVAGVGSDRVDGVDDSAVHEVAQASQSMTVIGSSQVDYYA
jgi:flagellar hook-length control protein FliK